MATFDNNRFAMNIDGFAMNVEVVPGALPMDTLFIHGNLASNTWWRPSMEIWKREAKPSYEGRAIMAEWRGCGKSAHPKSESELDMTSMAMDYVHLLRQMGVKKTCVVGHSTGGLIAMIAMMKAPELFDRAVLLDSVAGKGVALGPEMYAAFTQMSENFEVCKNVMNGTIYNNDPNSPVFKQICEDAFNIGKLNWHGVANVLAKTDVVSDIDKIQQPVLVLHGEHDPILPLEGSETLAKLLPNGKFTLLKGQGHSANVENPSLFVRLVNEFLFYRP